MKLIIKLSLLCFILFFTTSSFAFKLDELSGSDLGMGTGARAIALGGAFTALADDASACFWNPAGLVHVKKNEFTVMIDTPREVSLLAIVIRDKGGRVANWAIAGARVNRLYYKATGDWGENQYAGHLIDLSMINVEKDYLGGIDSLTLDKRISFATRIGCRWSVGVTCVSFKCFANFYDKGEDLPKQKVGYETFDLGVLYQPSEKMRLGFMFKNVKEPSKPQYVTLGTALFKKGITYTIDSEYIFGTYGENEKRKCRFWFIRGGVEKDWKKNLKARMGIVIPLKAYTSTLGDLKKNIPSPGFGGALGIGYEDKDYKLDFALFGDIGRSYIKHKPVLSPTVSASYLF